MQRLTHLQALEAESIHILREVATEFQRPVMLYSIGKDSSVMLRLAQKAFHPGPIPFPLLHVDTGYKFREMIEFRDALHGAARGQADRPPERGGAGGRGQSVQAGDVAVLRAAEDAVAARRAAARGVRRGVRRGAAGRGKVPGEGEDLLLPRLAMGSGTRRTSGRSCGTFTTAGSSRARSIRVFPLSNWTELDVWHYIHLENIPVVPMYFAQDREVLVRGEQLISLEQPFVPMLPGEKPKMVRCRMRSLGCSPCTGAIRSDADTIPKIIEELIGFRRSERENRVIDHDQEGSMEIKKREGYF